MVSEIGLGCWSFGGAYGPTTEAEAHDTLASALDLGVDFLDTANVYGMGQSETIIGSFLKGRQDLFTIATKGGIRRDPATGKRTFDNKPDYLRAELEASLTRLGMDCVDLYYIHRRDPEVPIEEVMQHRQGVVLRRRGQDRRHRLFGNRARLAAPCGSRGSGRCGAKRILSLDPPARTGDDSGLPGSWRGLRALFTRRAGHVHQPRA